MARRPDFNDVRFFFFRRGDSDIRKRKKKNIYSRRICSSEYDLRASQLM